MKINKTEIKLSEAESTKDYQNAAELFKEYACELGFDLEFQNFEEELKNIKAQYSRPYGIIILAQETGKKPVGCVGIRKLEGDICELKRMYIKKEGRGQGIGKAMLKKAIEIAQELGYTKIRLDTLPAMKSAIKLYENERFYQIEPYRYNSIKGAEYYEKSINN